MEEKTEGETRGLIQSIDGEELSGSRAENEGKTLGYMPGGLNYSTSWRYLSKIAKLQCYASAIQSLGEPVLFSLLFTNETRRRMRAAESSELNYIAQRIRRRLKGVPFFFVIERAPISGKLHVHGALSRTHQTNEEIRNALRSVCGDPKKARTRGDRFFIQARAAHIMPPDWTKHFKGMYGIFGWTEYCAKDLAKTAELLELEGSLISKTQSVHNAAIAIYETFRTFHGP